jgi:uncharacterized membrane protein
VTGAARISDTASWLVLIPLSLAGLGTSSYLTYSHYADQATVCAGVGSCEFVQSSEYSEIIGVPVALMGLLFFFALAALSLLRVILWQREVEWARPLAFSMSLGGTAFVSYLTYVELFVIDAICVWCVATAALTIASLLAVLWGAAFTARPVR